MGWRRTDRERHINADRRVSVVLTKTAATRLAALAVLHHMSAYSLMRSAIESYAHADADEREVLPDGKTCGPPPPPEPATVHVRLALQPETHQAVKALAREAQTTQTAIIRSAFNALAAETDEPPLFATVAHGQPWPRPKPDGDLVGTVFGSWTVIAEAQRSTHARRYRQVLCRCICGVTRPVRVMYLQNGRSRSCGCGPRGAAATVKLKGFASRTPVGMARPRWTFPSED